MNQLWDRERPKGLEHLVIRESRTDDRANPDFVVDFGTSTTVVAAFREPPPHADQFPVRFLIGGSAPFPSVVLLGDRDQVLTVGPDVTPDAMMRPGVKAVHSLKRYIELLSRTRQPAAAQASIVAQYLSIALGQPYEQLPGDWKLSAESQVFVSVPNSFNGTAIRAIRDGVIQALETLTDVIIDPHSVHVVREGEAVASLYAFQKAAKPRNLFPLRWVRLRTSSTIQSPDQIKTEKFRAQTGVIVVLDVGAGTTDLSVYQSGSTGSEPRVLLNCGVPIGGSDVDRILMWAMTARRDFWTAEADRTERIVAENEVRSRKERVGMSDFFGSDYEAWRWSADEKTYLARAELAAHKAIERTNDRLSKVVRISVDGLFELIPERIVKDGIDAVLLTGRGSLVPEIRSAVAARAVTMSAPVLTIGEPNYQLKLAVAYGCMAGAGQGAKWRQLPTTTLGREMSITIGPVLARDEIFVEADLVVSTDVPTLWRMELPPSKGPLTWSELRVSRQSARSLGADQLDRLVEGLGLIRSIVYRRESRRSSPVHVLWDPTLDEYFVPGTNAEPWVPASEPSFTLRDVNPLTGLPFGFPYE